MVDDFLLDRDRGRACRRCQRGHGDEALGSGVPEDSEWHSTYTAIPAAGSGRCCG